MQGWVVENWSVRLLALHLQSHPRQEATSEVVKQEELPGAEGCTEANSVTKRGQGLQRGAGACSGVARAWRGCKTHAAARCGSEQSVIKAW